MRLASTWLRRALFGLYSAFVLFLLFGPVTGAPGALSPLVDVPWFDKGVHVGLFFGVGVLGRWNGLAAWTVLGLGVTTAGVTEIVQGGIAYRSAEWWDFWAGALGCGLGVLAARAVFRRPSPD